MRFGLVGRFGGPQAQSNRERFALVEEAERLGFCSFWLNEEHFLGEHRIGTSPLVVAAAIAARTTRLRVGTAVILLPLHHPLQVAEDAVTLDVISDGRLDVGVSRSGNSLYFTGFDADPSERHGRFDEALSILRGAWTQEHFSFQGRYYRVPEISLFPRPVQRPHPPLYVATYSLETVAECARLGVGVLEGGVEAPASVKAKVGTFSREWARHWPSREPPAVPVSRTLYVGRDDASAWRDVEEYLRAAYRGRKQRPSDLPFDVEAPETAIIGGAASVRRRLEELHDECGVRYINLLVHSFWYVPAELHLASMRRLAEEVMPYFDTAPDRDEATLADLAVGR
jgi:alkanesulfonate monooxygenase SsuD/methylene tetrahydromethanopterin reductase-like flavin-dependent oxidoreductase (luciferase family)